MTMHSPIERAVKAPRSSRLRGPSGALHPRWRMAIIVGASAWLWGGIIAVMTLALR